MAVNNSSAFDFERFEVRTAAPEKNAEHKEVEFKKVMPASAEEIKRQQKVAFRKSVRMFCFVSLMFVAFAMQVSAGAKNFALERNIHALEYEISVAQSENTRLKSELNGITGIAFIDNYATEVLGMTKVEGYQVECVDLSGEDSVLYYGAGFGK